ncbi:putative sugar transporter-2 [Coleophoma cylindrospora]|uniref:Putative sugar transporter-2 n=1 Tax=Coleophoma cylindrospora TaxID=1849047 RepID=A0A3D8QFQ5_9HELO|nr:putative sugar transporter-2 [Coleophoma cylindrospora]
MSNEMFKGAVVDDEHKIASPETGETSSVHQGVVEDLLNNVDLEDLKIAGLDPTFEAKSDLVNKAIQTIGMGKYQWLLFVVTGFGWMVDQAMESTTSLILARVEAEFNPRYPAFLSLAQTIGLVVGASFWGFGSDVVGRRFTFNCSFLICGVFLLAAGGGYNFVSTAALIAVAATGCGGNLVVDSAIFLEFVPASHQWLLFVLATWWDLGQIIPSAIAWGFLPKYSCPSDVAVGECTKGDNLGWRYVCFTMGALTLALWAIRFFIFELFETPKYLVGQNRNVEAVEVLNKLAKFNGASSQPLTVAALEKVELETLGEILPPPTPDTIKQISQRAFKTLGEFKFTHFRALFDTRKNAISISLVVTVWAIIGLAAPLYGNFLPVYLETHGAESGNSSINTTYRNNFIIVCCSIPGTIIGGWIIDWKIGRRGVLSASLISTAVFYFAFTSARTQGAILGFNCASSVTSYMMWAALYCYTPEVLPSVHRGTGAGLAAVTNRVFAIPASIIAQFAGFGSNVPLFISAALYVAAGLVTLAFPYEPRGKASV